MRKITLKKLNDVYQNLEDAYMLINKAKYAFVTFEEGFTSESKMHIDDAIDSLNHPMDELIRWIEYKERQIENKKTTDNDVVN